MSKEVNLISSRRKEESVSYRQVALIKKISYTTVGVCVLITIGLFGLNSISSIQNLSQKEKDLSQTLFSYQKKIVSIALIKDRLTSINQITSASSPYEDVIQEISSALSKDASFDQFDINKKNLNITVSSASLVSVNSFLDYCISNVNKKHLFQKVTISSLLGDLQTGKYILILNITLL